LRVLIAEDDATLQVGLRQALEHAGHEAIVAGDGIDADLLLANEPFDLLVLDLGLPHMSGISVLQRMRARHQATPVLILSARDSTEDRVRGLDAGADDYLTKPFELTEFEARVRALLRRLQGPALRIGTLEWSWDSHQGRVGDAGLNVSRGEALVLEVLLRTPGRIVAKDVIAQRISSVDEPTSDNVVEVHVHRLRRKLTDAGIEIRTVRGLGYLLREIPESS
jgi:DNA-binding response OmpR family regulator